MSNVSRHFKGKGAMALMILIDQLPHRTARPESHLLRRVESLCEELESISEAVRIYPLKSETSPFRAFATNKPQQMPRHAAIPS
jgi:hypothetical protein